MNCCDVWEEGVNRHRDATEQKRRWTRDIMLLVCASVEKAGPS